MKSVYLDHHATTPCDPRVVEVMLPFFSEDFGNAASSSHGFGRRAASAVERAREQVAALIGAKAREIVFTSGATECDNLALKGVFEAAGTGPHHLVTSLTEHRAVIDTARWLEARGHEVTWLSPQRDGRVAPDDVQDAIRPRTLLVSVMHANNEIGVVSDISAIGRICKEQGVLFHTDAAQSAGLLPIDVEQMGIDLLSVSAHKMYGPKGVGALYVRSRYPKVTLAPQMHGGGHERGTRSGTLPVPLLVGFGEACQLALQERGDSASRIYSLRERLRSKLLGELDGVTVHGSLEHRLPGNLNMSFRGVPADALMASMPDVSVSSGSACSSGTIEPSYVLRALGVEDDHAFESIRFGIGRFNTEEEIDLVAAKVTEIVERLRMCSMAP